MYIPTCRLPSPPAVATLSHRPRDCPASLSHLANDRPMHYQFFTFWPWGITHGPEFTKGEMTWRTPRSTILQSFTALHPPTLEISVTKNPADTYTHTHTHKQTVNDISTTCLSACVDNKYASYPDWCISPHADCRHRQRWPVCHTGLATARSVCRTWLTTVQCIINFSLFGLGG